MSKTKKKKSNSKAKIATKPKKGNTLLFPCLFLFALSFLLYANTLTHEYALDDYSAIKENYVVKRGLGGMNDIFTKHYRYGYWVGKGTLYRPITLAMFATEWNIKEDAPGFYHFMNIFWYGLSGVLLFLVLKRLFRKYHPALAFIASCIFIAHPVHTEVVANIKSRDEIMALLFCLAALYGLLKYLDKDKILWMGLALISYLLAMFTKENAVTFLAVFPLAMFLFSKVSLPKNLTLSALFVIPVGMFLFVRQSVLGEIKGVDKVSVLDNFIAGADGFTNEIATALMMAGKYLQVLFFPHPLVSEYGFNHFATISMGSWKALLPGLILLGLLILGIYAIKNHKILAFGILFFFITFSIYSNIFITIGSSYGERFLYFPSLGFAIAAAWGLMKLFKVDIHDAKADLKSIAKTPVLAGILGVLMLGYAGRTMARNPVWHNSYTLYNADLKYVPNSAKLRFHHALELVKFGKKETGAKAQEWFNKAELDFLKAIEIYPKYADAYGEIGLLYYRKNDLKKAIANYEKALEYKPKASVYSNMGIIYFSQGQFEQAKDVYEKAISLDPRFVDALRNLGAVHAQMKNYPEAIKNFKKALEFDPKNSTILYYLGLAYRDMGDLTTGKQYNDRARVIDPKLPAL